MEKTIKISDLTKGTLNNCKRPFYYDKIGQSILDQNGRMIIQIRCWGWIQKLKDAELRQDDLGNCIVELLNS